ncbi:hypothetical protein ACSZOP_00405 [Colibacter massiliensis]|uniref:hypothetical protein n=1 Tax=Colibacter massiliensis TaxID=1852379 RepID=UPI00094ECBA3|nr:hypothetical protein [Colibacter massiliensis]
MKQVRMKTLQTIRAYIRTLRQYAASPKTQYEYKHYGIFLILFALVVILLWGGIYVYEGH